MQWFLKTCQWCINRETMKEMIAYDRETVHWNLCLTDFMICLNCHLLIGKEVHSLLKIYNFDLLEFRFCLKGCPQYILRYQTTDKCCIIFSWYDGTGAVAEQKTGNQWKHLDCISSVPCVLQLFAVIFMFLFLYCASSII